MSVHRLAKYQTDDPFTRIPNTAINSGMSLKALGLLVFMLSKPDGWNFTERGLMAQLETGRHSLATGMAELIERGYVRRTSTVEENMRRWVTEVYDVPCFDFPSIESSEHREIEALSNNGTQVTKERSKDKRQRKMPKGWSPSDQTKASMKDKHPTLNLDSEIEAFEDYHSSKGSKFVDWDRAFQTWCRNADKWSKKPEKLLTEPTKFPAGSGGVFL